MSDILVGMLKRERQNGNAKPSSSSESESSRRNRKFDLSKRSASGLDSQNHEVSSERTEQTLEERRQPVVTKEEAHYNPANQKTLHSQQMKDDMSQARREAFEVFRAEYSHNANIEDNKQTLKQRYGEAKSLGEQVNNSRKKINTLKTQIEQQRIRRSMQVQDDRDDSEEDNLRQYIEDEKARYKEAFTRLRSLKTEIEHLQHLLEKAKVQMQKDFEVWWNEQSLPHRAQHKKISQAWKTPTPPLSPIRPQDSRPRSSTDPRQDSDRSSNTLRYSKLQTEATLASSVMSGGSDSSTGYKQDAGPTRQDKRPPSGCNRRNMKNAYEDAKRFSSSSGKNSFNLTGDSRADEDIMAFIRARQSLLDQRGSSHR